MDLSWIEDFLAVVECKGFARAARQRNITQSAFSKRIRSLENHLGGELIVRNRQPLELTELGEQFLNDCKPIIVSVRRAEENARQLLGHDRYLLKFSGATTLVQSFYPSWITRKKAMMPEIVPNVLSSRTTPEDVQALDSGEFDFFLTYHSSGQVSSFDLEQFEYKILGPEQVVPVCVPDKDGITPSINLDDLNGVVPYVARLPGSYIGNVVESRIAENNLQVLKTCQGTNGENLLGLVLEGNGITWMPYDRIKNLLAEKKLVLAGGASWTVPIEVRIYKRLGRSRTMVNKFWASITESGKEFPIKA